MSEKWKDKAKETARLRGMYSCMNDTKWGELLKAMLNEMPFPPPFIVKYIFEDMCPEEKAFCCDIRQKGGLPGVTGDWRGLSTDGHTVDGAAAIEWIKIYPVILESCGRLIEPKRTDAAEQLVGILKKHGIPYEETDGLYCVRGYEKVL